MSKVMFKDMELHTNADQPQLNTPANDFCLVKSDLSCVSLADFQGKKLVLNIFPSIDTAVCATSVRKFNEIAQDMDNTVVLCISRDLPFAQTRFCGAEGLKNVVTLSEYRNNNFSESYGVRLVDGPFEGLMARAVFVLDAKHKVVYKELVANIAQEPNYEKALQAL